MNTSNTNQFIPSTIYGFTPLKEVKAGTKVPEGMRECRTIIKGDKTPGKVSQYCTLPEVTDGLAQAIVRNTAGMILIKDFIESLQNKVVRNVYLKEGRSVNQDDLTIEQLIKIGELEGETARLTKESIGVWFDSVKDGIKQFIADTKGLDVSDSRIEIWAGNFKPLFVELAGRNPSIASDVKAKMELVAVAVMTGTMIEEKILEKLENAVEKSADDLGL